MQPNMDVDKIKFCHDTRHKSDLKETIILPEYRRTAFLYTEPKRPFTTYKKKVWDLTKQVTHLIPGIEKRGFKELHIDHITSIWDGFKLGIPAERIADINNLRMLPYKENMNKGIKSGHIWK